MLAPVLDDDLSLAKRCEDPTVEKLIECQIRNGLAPAGLSQSEET